MKLLTCLLSLVLLCGCMPLPALSAQAPPATGIVAPAAAAEPTPLPVPGVTRAPVPVPTFTPIPTFTPAPTCTPTPMPTPTPSPTPQTCSGDIFRFDLPCSWSKVATDKGIFFYPDPGDTRRTFLAFREMDNSLRLTETAVDITLKLSSQATITKMVAEVIDRSGMKDYTLGPVSVEKTQLNGLPCYRGAADITLAGTPGDLIGYLFLRGKKLVVLVWVGDAAEYAEGLDMVYRSIQPIQ